MNSTGSLGHSGGYWRDEEFVPDSDKPWLTGEFGYGHQRTTVRQDGPDSEQRFTWGTRSENRLYLIAELQTLGLRARFIETIELDDEGYDAVSDHDKGFIQIQADF